MTNKSGDGETGRQFAAATRLTNAGRHPFDHHGYVNTPVYHASTLLYRSAQDYLDHRGRYQYGRRGTPTSEALQTAIAALEGPNCAAVALLPSGLAAIAAALLSALRAGDHVLVTDSAYGPTRNFCDTILSRYDIATSYYDPRIGGGIADLMKPNTRAVFLESPGSLSFEVQDVPAIAAEAHERGAAVLMDNTWATPIHFGALEKGVDLSIQSGTKYIGGHSDVMLGTVAANKTAAVALTKTVYDTGMCVGPDDMFLALRGLRTLGVRLAQHYAAGIKVARWLEAHPQILRVVHPALESHPDHALWKRDFSGACGLFSVVFKPAPVAAIHAFLDRPGRKIDYEDRKSVV
jgi:cystathionine beta-lyase